MFAWLLLVSRADRSRALRLRAGSGGSCRRLAPSVQLARPPTLLRPGQPPAAATSTAGDRMAVQGVSGARWRCWPSSLESSFYSEIQGGGAVEAGGSGGGGCVSAPAARWPWLPAPIPASCAASGTLAARPAGGGCSLNGGRILFEKTQVFRTFL